MTTSEPSQPSHAERQDTERSVALPYGADVFPNDGRHLGITWRLVRQLLVRPDTPWSGQQARFVVNRALIALRVGVTDQEHSNLMAAAFRVGRLLEPIEGLTKRVPWSAEAVRESLKRGPLPESMIPPELVIDLAGKVKGAAIIEPHFVDWVTLINRSIMQVCSPDVLPELHDRLALAEHIEWMLACRVHELAAFAADTQEVSLVELEESVREAIDERRAMPVRQATVAIEQSDSREELGTGDLETLAVAADSRVRDAFVLWVKQQTFRVQRSVLYRLSLLSSDPVARRVWTKPIVGQATRGVIELKVVADGNHFRLLLAPAGDSRWRVLAFGLRRDLADLVEAASCLLARETL